ncbi:MAG TPA: hypothetical protein DEB39_00085 [Planctomycetaceae bacterium]|nr:hypothetical protein [Planctomycetaceae bacterium]
MRPSQAMGREVALNAGISSHCVGARAVVRKMSPIFKEPLAWTMPIRTSVTAPTMTGKSRFFPSEANGVRVYHIEVIPS